MMVLPLASALGKIDPGLEDAARTLGATAGGRVRRVTLPLSVPGLTVGFTLVFSLTAGSFVTPAILGGNSGNDAGQAGRAADPRGLRLAVRRRHRDVLVVVVLRDQHPVDAPARTAPRRAPMSDRLTGPGAWLLYSITGVMMVFILAPLPGDRDFVLRHATSSPFRRRASRCNGTARSCRTAISSSAM